jgi:DNA-binding NarL/FixJ family response regulator
MQTIILETHSANFELNGVLSTFNKIENDKLVYLSVAEEHLVKLKNLMEMNGIPFEQKTISPQESNSDSLPVFVKSKLDYFELSNRETEVMKELLKGFEYQDIADRLFISLETVRSHVKNIFRKLGVSSRAEANARIMDFNHGMVG